MFFAVMVIATDAARSLKLLPSNKNQMLHMVLAAVETALTIEIFTKDHRFRKHEPMYDSARH